MAKQELKQQQEMEKQKAIAEQVCDGGGDGTNYS